MMQVNKILKSSSSFLHLLPGLPVTSDDGIFRLTLVANILNNEIKGI
jgi:hypothetical protein